MTHKELIIKVKEKIDTPEKWTKGFYARDKNHVVVDETSDKACKFCLLGALSRVGYESDTSATLGPILQLFRLKAHSRGYDMITSFNDDKLTTHEDVMKLLDEVIEDQNGN